MTHRAGPRRRFEATMIAGAVVACLGFGVGRAQQPAPAQPPPPPPPADRQQRASGQPTFRTGVSLVRVDVTATGKNDEAVSDLKPTDFEVREDDALQTIETFQFVRLTGEATAADDTSLPIRSREHAEAEIAREDVRVFVLFMDDYHISEDIATTQRVRASLTSWLESTFKPTDILIWMDPLTPISALEYTRNPGDLIEKVKKFKGRRGVYTPVRSVLEEGQLQARNPARIRAEVTLSALNAIVTHLGSLRERRTSIIFVSEGPRTYFSDANIDDALQDVLQAANRFNVTINVMDPRGLTSVAPADTLWRLAGETGGRAIVNTNGFTNGLSQVVKDASADHLLGYQPTHGAADGKFHKIDVRSLRKGVHVLARKGYWSPSEKEITAAAATPTAPAGVTAALTVVDQVENSQALTWLGFEPGPPSLTRVSLSWQPRRATSGPASPTRLTVTAEPLGGDRPPIVRERPVALNGDNAIGSPGTTTFDAPPGAMKLTLLLEAGDGDVIDRWTEKVDVPAFAPDSPALGTARLLLARNALQYRALVANSAQGVPTPLREFRRTDRVLVQVPVLGASPAPAVVKAVLLNRAGNELVTLTPTAPGPDLAQTELPLANLATGDYVLRIEATSAGRAPLVQHVAFRVVP